MSVLIYGIDNEAKGFPTLIVSSEVNFHTIWEPAIMTSSMKQHSAGSVLTGSWELTRQDSFRLFKAAKEAFSQIKGPLPKIRELNEEYERVLREKKQTYVSQMRRRCLLFYLLLGNC